MSDIEVTEVPQTKKRRPRRLRAKRVPDLNIDQILSWVDNFKNRTGRWPTSRSGHIPETAGDTWNAVEHALARGSRGLDTHCTLAQFLAKHRGTRNTRGLPRLSEELILRWADEHFKQTGCYPTSQDGAVVGAPGETWRLVAVALRHGGRGLPTGSSLSRLLARHRHVRNRKALPRLTIAQVLIWADAYHRQHGFWPQKQSGSIPEAPGETWGAIDAALHNSCRGFPGDSSLARVLEEHRQVRNRKHLPHLTVPNILRWAHAHYDRTGHWPNENSGAVVDAPGETWSGVNAALSCGIRGLPGDSSLFRLLSASKHR